MTCACCDLEKPVTVPMHCHPEIEICSDCLDWLVRRRDKQQQAVGPVRIVSDDPIFFVADVKRSADHFTKLGFAINFHDDTYAFAERDGLIIHLDQDEEPRVGGCVYLHVSDAEELAEQWRKAGLVVDGPRDYDYGKHEGSHTDPDGNIIRFGSPLRGN